MANALESRAAGAGLRRSPAFGHARADAVGTRSPVGGIPCRVVDIIDESQRQGFAYGTLPGHPEAGEERFVLEQLEDGRIRFTITAYSRPASRLARLGGPIGRAAQSFMTKRYLRSLDRL